MKKNMKHLFISLLFLTTICGCGTTSSSTPSDVFIDQIVYDKSAEAYDVSIKLESNQKIASITCGRISATSKEYSLKNNVLTLSKSFMDQITSGDDKKIVVTFKDGSSTKISAFVATKVIKTAEDFQNINDNLNGFYILGNDIDLSSISNFEPLGRFYEETDVRNAYFHGVLEGNGYSVKNAHVYYTEDSTSSKDVYLGHPSFSEECHQNGDNIGLFQIIGSSGVVRNVVFDNINVRGRTIVGAIAGNVQGLIENCYVTSSCSVQMSTHFYDNDCNAGGVAGIVAGSGRINNTISLMNSVTINDIFTDYGDDYQYKSGNGWDHTADATSSDASWKFAGVDRDALSGSGKEIDSNGSQTNGIYAFAGKVWGEINNSYALSFKTSVYVSEGNYTIRDVNFAQTHLAVNKPTSGDTDMGLITSSGVYTLDELKSLDLYSSYDSASWNITSSATPTLKCPIIGQMETK